MICRDSNSYLTLNSGLISLYMWVYKLLRLHLNSYNGHKTTSYPVLPLLSFQLALIILDVELFYLLDRTRSSPHPRVRLLRFDSLTPPMFQYGMTDNTRDRNLSSPLYLYIFTSCARTVVGKLVEYAKLLGFRFTDSSR